MKPLAVPPDAERVTIDILTTELAATMVDATVGVNVPSAWAVGTKPHVQVALDGTPSLTYPILWVTTVRITTWHASTTTAKALAALCQAILCSYAGSAAVASVQPLTGVLPTRDPDTGAQLASVTVRMNLLGSVI